MNAEYYYYKTWEAKPPPNKVKDSQGYAGFKGVKVRLINNQ
jgi:hypothetical protein